jgi:hypothetical protein
MLLPAFSDPKYRELKDVIEGGFVELGLPFEVGPYHLPD